LISKDLQKLERLESKGINNENISTKMAHSIKLVNDIVNRVSTMNQSKKLQKKQSVLEQIVDGSDSDDSDILEEQIGEAIVKMHTIEEEGDVSDTLYTARNESLAASKRHSN
jgi:hypothetical protein